MLKRVEKMKKSVLEEASERFEAIRGTLAGAVSSGALAAAAFEINPGLVDVVGMRLDAVREELKAGIITLSNDRRVELRREKAALEELFDELHHAAEAVEALRDEKKKNETLASMKQLQADTEKMVKRQRSLLAEAGPLVEKLMALGADFDTLDQTVREANNQLRKQNFHDLLTKPVLLILRIPGDPESELPNPFGILSQLGKPRALVDLARRAAN